MDRRTYEATLEDVSINTVGLVKAILNEYIDNLNDTPATICAVASLLSRTENYLENLDTIISKNIGKLMIIIPEFEHFYWDRLIATEDPIVDVEIIPNEETVKKWCPAKKSNYDILEGKVSDAYRINDTPKRLKRQIELIREIELAIAEKIGLLKGLKSSTADLEKNH